MSQTIFTSVCGNNYKYVQLGLTYTLNTGKTKNFENLVGTNQRRCADRAIARGISFLAVVARMLSVALAGDDVVGRRLW